jgi:hypothetical protein
VLCHRRAAAVTKSERVVDHAHHLLRCRFSHRSPPEVSSWDWRKRRRRKEQRHLCCAMDGRRQRREVDNGTRRDRMIHGGENWLSWFVMNVWRLWRWRRREDRGTDGKGISEIAGKCASRCLNRTLPAATGSCEFIFLIYIARIFSVRTK